MKQFMFCIVCKGPSNHDVGGGGKGTVFQEIRPRASFETGDIVKRMLEGLP